MQASEVLLRATVDANSRLGSGCSTLLGLVYLELESGSQGLLGVNIGDCKVRACRVLLAALCVYVYV